MHSSCKWAQFGETQCLSVRTIQAAYCKSQLKGCGVVSSDPIQPISLFNEIVSYGVKSLYIIAKKAKVNDL